MLHGAVTGGMERVLLQCSDERLPGKADRAAHSSVGSLSCV